MSALALMRPLFAAFLLGSVLCGGAVAQSASRAGAPLPELPSEYPDRLELKLAEGSGAEWRDGALRSRTGVDLSAVAALLRGFEVRPMVTAVSRERLDAWHAHACAVQPAHNRPGHLGLWFCVRGDDADAVASLRERLAAEPLVEHVYHEPVIYPASFGAALPPGGDPAPPTPSFTAMQLEHGPTPIGHGTRFAAGILGARGQGVGFRMIEHSWIWGHEDLCQVVATNVIGAAPVFTAPEANHGIAGASIAFGDRNAWGVTGVADEVGAKFLAIYPNGGFANAVALALANSQPGDVAMAVVMVLVSSFGPGSWLPVEFLQAAFDATLTATSNGLHFVVPAGNGNRNLDDPALLGRFDRNFRDSGAIMVAASAAGALQRAAFSNYGSRIDAHSWGDQVVAAGYGTLFFGNNDPLQSYTAAATGTSSATPHVAGIVAALQGAARRQLGQSLSNQEILDLLHTVGPTTPDVIGRRPDLEAMLRQLGVIDGLTMAEPDVARGGTIVADLEGPIGSIAALFAAYQTADVPLGYNRNIHLDLGQLVAVGAFVLGAGTAQYQLAVPNTAVLQDLDIYYQAVRVDPNQLLYVTNSCQVTIL
ncbi:MAG TPA: hypothetical protein ENI87_06535 [bacterium]|nr:hypothetical protein [bacterium]